MLRGEIMSILEAPARAAARVRAAQARVEKEESMATSMAAGGETIRVGGTKVVMDRVSGSSGAKDKMATHASAAADAQAGVEHRLTAWRQACDRVEAMLEPLSVRAYEVLHAIYVLEMNTQEIADHLEVSNKTVIRARAEGIGSLMKESEENSE